MPASPCRSGSATTAALVALTLTLSIPPALATGSAPQGEEDEGRRPVLSEVRVPHPYYWREMYIPRVSGGPRSPAWSPDGTELVYSMRGSLWRQELDSETAVQLTDGPGYHHQPDWSPDGRWIVYTAYDGEAFHLRVLDLRGGSGDAVGRESEAMDGEGGEDGPAAGLAIRDRVLLRDGGVNLEPRFCPQGDRIAFVSTAELGRWHVRVAPFDEGRLGRARRVTEDRDSGLPRYYYDVYDHYLSPSWSPEGDELLLVSNRGRIWGTGGFWRLPLDPEAEAREIRYEETTWRARPDWSPDGNRVVYASYLGRQRHQLWLMTDEGGDVFPITYGAFAPGDHDATEPRWSPEGDRIAYVSNQGGATSIRVVDVPGGRRRPLEISERRTLRPTGRVRLDVAVPSGDTVPARISVTGEDGRGWAPAGQPRHVETAFDRGERAFERSYFHATGSATLELPAGSYAVEVTRGPEHAPVRRRVAVTAGETATEEFVLEPLADLEADGWYSGDLHVHMNYGGTYSVEPRDLVARAAAVDLDVVENLVVNKEQRIPDIGAFRTDRDPASTGGRALFHGQEFHTSFWGHTALLGLRSHLLLPDYAGYVNTAAASLYPHNAKVLERAREQGAVTGYVHPFESVPDPSDRSTPLTHELPADVALGTVDYLEVVGFSDHLATAEVWYRLLNCGFRVAAGAGTDAAGNFASGLGGPFGLRRTYVRFDGELDHRAFLAGVRAGRTFATNGPLLRFSIEGAGIGDEIELGAGSHELRVRGSLRSAVPVDRLQIVGNGEVVAELPLSGDGRSVEIDRRLQVDASGWYTLRAWGEDARRPVADAYPFATTSPIWVTVGGEPVRSADAAAYFLAWIDRLVEAARDSDAYNTAGEREAVLDTLSRAKEVYRQRGGTR